MIQVKQQICRICFTILKNNSLLSNTIGAFFLISNFITSDLLVVNNNMFQYCTNLKTLIINNPNLFKITNVNAFSNSLIASGTGYVYVPDNMVETYKTATNWSYYSSQIKPLSELVENE